MSSNPTSKIAICSENRVIEEGLSGLFRQNGWHVTSYRYMGDIPVSTPELKIDLLIVDISHPGLSDDQWLMLENKCGEHVRVLAFNNVSWVAQTRSRMRSRVAGLISGFESKAEIIAIARQVIAGRSSRRSLNRMASRKPRSSLELTEREWEIFELLGRGKQNSQIARVLGISVKTVETHKEHLKQKLNLKSTSDLLEFAVRERGDRGS